MYFFNFLNLKFSLKNALEISGNIKIWRKSLVSKLLELNKYYLLA